MESLGELLKAARERKNLSLHAVAEETRISVRYLEAIEQGRYRDLPGGMYNRAFIRSFADYVGLDTQQALECYESEAPPGERSVRAKIARPEQHREPLRLHPLVIWSVMLLLSVAGLYLNRDWISGAFSPYFAQRPPIPEPSRSAPPSTPPGGAAVSSSQPNAGLPAAPVPSEPSMIPAPGSAPPGDMTTSAATEPQPAPEGNAALRIEFEVLDKCWVSVNSDGTRVLVRLLEPGARQAFDANERFYIVLGNAGGVRLRINGKPARPLGKPGEVVKVLITTQNLPDFLENPSG
jgi:cytoskeletal protein RodZ